MKSNKLIFGFYRLCIGASLVFLVISATLFSGCGHHSGENGKLSVEYPLTMGKMGMKPDKTIIFDFDTNMVADPILIFHDDLTFLFYDGISGKIVLFNGNALVDVVDLDGMLERYGYSGYKQTVFALNSDSIYFFMYKTLFLLDKNKDILEQIDLDLIYGNIAYTPWVGYQPFCIDRENRKLYHHVSPGVDNSNREYYNCPQFVEVDLKTYETSFINIDAPVSFERGKAYGQYSDPLLAIGDNELIYSYHINTDICFYDLLSNKGYLYGFVPDLVTIDRGLKPSRNKKKLVLQFRNENKLHGLYYDNGNLFLVYEEGYDMETNNNLFKKFIYVIDIKMKKVIVGQEFPLYDEGKFLSGIKNNKFYFMKKDLDNEKNELEMDVYDAAF